MGSPENEIMENHSYSLIFIFVFYRSTRRHVAHVSSSDGPSGEPPSITATPTTAGARGDRIRHQDPRRPVLERAHPVGGPRQGAPGQRGRRARSGFLLLGPVVVLVVVTVR